MSGEDLPDSKKRIECQCLYEIRNKLPRTKFCRRPCDAQILMRNVSNITTAQDKTKTKFK